MSNVYYRQQFILYLLSRTNYSQCIQYISVADLEIQKGGFNHWCTKHTKNFLGCHAHFWYVNTLMTHVITVATGTDALVAS